MKIWQNTTWMINLHASEIEPKTRKQKAEGNVVIQQAKKKITRLQEELETCQQQRNQQKIVASPGLHEPKHCKPWTEYSPQYKRLQKWEIASKVTTALEFTKNVFF